MISGASDEELDIAIARTNVLLELQPKIDELKKENQQLKEQLQQKEDIVNKAKEYIKDNANIYTNIMGKKVGFFKRHNDGWTPIELLEILDNKGE